MNTITSIRINSDLLEKIKMYSEIEGCTQTDFINDLVSDGLDQYLLQRSGGAVLTLPNPQNYSIDSDKARSALSILCAAAESIHNMNANLPLPLFAVLAFYEQRLFHELPEDAERFRNNLILDCTQCDVIANDKQ